MNYRTFAAAAALTAAVAVGTQAFAQAKPAAAAAAPARPAAAAATPAPAPLNFAAPPPGVCVLDVQRMGATSMAGKSAAARLKVIHDQVEADLNTQGKQLQADANALAASKATLDQGSYEGRAAQLQVRANTLQRLAEQREAEMERTAQIAQGLLFQAAEPSITAVFQSRNCSMLFNSAALFVVNPQSDITAAVVAHLDGRVQTLNFERANLSQQQQPAAPPARQ